MAKAWGNSRNHLRHLFTSLLSSYVLVIESVLHCMELREGIHIGPHSVKPPETSVVLYILSRGGLWSRTHWVQPGGNVPQTWILTLVQHLDL